MGSGKRGRVGCGERRRAVCGGLRVARDTGVWLGLERGEQTPARAGGRSRAPIRGPCPSRPAGSAEPSPGPALVGLPGLLPPGRAPPARPRRVPGPPAAPPRGLRTPVPAASGVGFPLCKPDVGPGASARPPSAAASGLTCASLGKLEGVGPSTTVGLPVGASGRWALPALLTAVPPQALVPSSGKKLARQKRPAVSHRGRF